MQQRLTDNAPHRRLYILDQGFEDRRDTLELPLGLVKVSRAKANQSVLACFGHIPEEGVIENCKDIVLKENGNATGRYNDWV